ncbi:MAG TPA: MFS transporter [Pasteurellaceae bacterium]|nr:MFS transporter [Pasteurellaceae bacterium]
MDDIKKYRSLAWIASIAFFMQALDSTILNTALPSISKDLNESPLEMQLAVISYALTVALFIPLSGWLADKYGTLKIFRFAVGMFVLGSIFCAVSQSLNGLIISRIIQGFGGALMMPVARLAIIRTIPKNQLLPVWNLMAMAGLTGPILGPILGGWLVTYATWHWIFLINIPIGLAGILLAGRYMPETFGKERHLDWKGFWLFGGGLVGITLGLDLITEAFVEKWMAASIILSGTLLLWFYYIYAKHAENALVPLALFKIRTFSIGIFSNLFIRLCASGIPFLLPLMLQVAFHYDADIAGWLIAPIAVSSILIKPLIGKFISSLGYKNALILTALALTLTIAAMSLLHAGSPLWIYITIVSVYGACISVIFTTVNTLTVSELDAHNASAGSTILSVVQQVGIGVGIAISSLILNIYRHFVGETGELLQRSFNYTFLTSAIFGMILVLLLTRLQQSDGEQLHKH